MNIEVLAMNELIKFKNEIIEEMKKCFKLSEEERIWLKSSEVKQLLGCSEGTLVNIRASGKLPYYKINGTVYYKKSDVNNLFESNLVLQSSN